MKLSIRNASVTLGGNTILEEVNLDITEHDHAAIVGRNGAGKTTLLKAIEDNELFDEGIGEEKFSINKIGKISVGYMKQIEFENENITLLDEIQKPFSELINMEKRLNHLIEEMNKSNSDELIKKYTDLQENFKILGGYSYKKEYEIMLNKFGFSSADKNKLIREFSGGERTKIAFIKLLLEHHDLLMLDEPTNHLDLESITALNNGMTNYKGCILFTSHDHELMNTVANRIIEIQE